MQSDVRLGAKGRVVLPAPLRRELGLREGSRLVARVEGSRLVLEPRSAVLGRVRRRFAGARAGLVDELLAERRAEARGEDA